MLCPHCQADTQVKDSRRRKDDNVMRRQRHCPNGHRFVTYESAIDPGGVIRQRQRNLDASRSYRARQDPEVLKERDRLKYLRRQARTQAAETGQTYEAVCAAWGIDPHPSRTRADRGRSRPEPQPSGA